MNTIENNKIIAEFMGYEILEANTENPYVDIYPKNEDLAMINGLPLLEFAFNSWDSLMEVVEKIGQTENFVTIKGNACQIKGNVYNNVIQDGTKIQSVYNACVGFIKWYNLND